jgi:ribosomal-protein-alanine N-acetyltransferase
MTARRLRADALRVPGLARAVMATPRIFLRYPTARDEGEFMGLKRASRRFLEPWEATPTNGLDTFGPRYYARILKNCRSELHQRFLICARDDGRVVGQIGLNSIVRGAFQSCYVGYWIGEAFARQGFATEALGLVLGFAFRKLKLHRVEANIVPRNRASRALARKCGLRYEGTSKRYLRVAYRWEDHEHWAITAEEWRPWVGRGRA